MQEEKKKLVHSLLLPSAFVVLLWAIKLVEVGLRIRFTKLGIYPMEAEGLIGIVTGPLIHSDFTHLISNTFPILILGTGIFYFYRKISIKVILWIYLMVGLWVWVAGRHEYHIGASGLIYGFASFLFFSGVIRKNTNLLAIALLVAFFYGGLVWGVLPLREGISWESHLFGAIAGGVVAFYFRREGPSTKKYRWEEEEELEQTRAAYWNYQNQTYPSKFMPPPPKRDSNDEAD